MKTINLNGIYQMYSSDGAISCRADIPGSDYGNLIRYASYSEKKIVEDWEYAKSVAVSDMSFERTFDLESLAYEHITLVCESIDTLCEIYINNRLAEVTENAHISYEFDIKDYLNEGQNTIVFKIKSPVKYIEEMQKSKPLPKNANGIDGAAYLRKPSCHFGWDWGPCVPYKYIGNVEIHCFHRELRLNSIKQEIIENKALITVNMSDADEMVLLTPDGNEILPDGNTFVVESPALWYTRDLSEKDVQPLYTLVLKNEETTLQRKIGIRKIELNLEKDEYGNNFQLVLNGKRIFGKGANLIPFSAIPEQADQKTIDYYLDLAVRSHFNMIRVWGGGTYASEYLLSRCDELGILVWQDFCYACLMYPFYEKKFLDNVIAEAKQNVRRMTLHPSLALLCGNNEIEAMFNYLPKSSKIVKAYVDFFYHMLPAEIDGMTDVAYIPTSPLGESPFVNNTSDRVGDTHMWNVWHGLKPLNYYEKRYTRFLSEFGLESLPSMKAIRTFADHRSYDLSSKEFMRRQKCVGGNEKMMFYLQERFDVPEYFEDLPYLTGIVRAECVEYAAAHFRRNKVRCNGYLFCQFNDVWNCPSWSSVDFEGVPKALQYKAQRFFSPICVTYNDGVLYLHNDTMADKNLDVKIVSSSRISEINVASSADSVTELMRLPLKTGEYMKVSVDGKDFFFDNVHHLKYANVSITKEDGDLVLKSDVYARNICLEGDSIPIENYFSLLPNEEKRIPYDGEIADLTVKCENNIRFIKGKTKKTVDRFFYRLKPMNIANAFYYRMN